MSFIFFTCIGIVLMFFNKKIAQGITKYYQFQFSKVVTISKDGSAFKLRGGYVVILGIVFILVGLLSLIMV